MLATVFRFLRQIVPPVIATLIAAVLIAGYNRTFSGHLSQPRLGGLQVEASTAPATATTVAMTKPPAPVAPAPVTEIITIHEYAIEPERLFDKAAEREAAKDQTAVKLAAAPAPRIAAPVAAAPVAAPVATPPVVAVPVIMAQPIAQPVTQEPMIAKPLVTVPDRAHARPAHEPQADAQTAPPQGPIGVIVNTLKPSSLLARAREFGEKIEAAGNEILPSIRQ